MKRCKRIFLYVVSTMSSIYNCCDRWHVKCVIKKLIVSVQNFWYAPCTLFYIHCTYSSTYFSIELSLSFDFIFWLLIFYVDCFWSINITDFSFLYSLFLRVEVLCIAITNEVSKTLNSVCFADSTRKPGPGAYSPENVRIDKPNLPSFSLGIRHSEFITPLIVGVE